MMKALPAVKDRPIVTPYRAGGCTMLVPCRCADHGGYPHRHWCARLAIEPGRLFCWQHERWKLP